MFLKISLVHWKIFFTYFTIKFDNLYWKWKWQKWILFYERSPSIKFKELLLLAVCIYKLSNKKLCISMCVYIIKKHVCIYMCVWGIILINILMLQLAPPPKKNSGSAPTSRAFHCAIEQWKKVVLQGVALKICSPCPPLLPI